MIMRRFNFAISCKGHTFRPKVERAGEQSELVWILPLPLRARSGSSIDRSTSQEKASRARSSIESRGIAGYL